MYFVWLFKIRSHFCQQFIGRNPNVNGKTKGVADGVFYLTGGRHGRSIAVRDSGKIQITLINADLLDIRCQCAQKFHQSVAVLFIKFVIGRCRNKIRAFSQSMNDRFTCFYAEGLCGNGFCQNNAVAQLLVAAYDSGNAAKVGAAACFQVFNRCPA